MRQVKDLLKSKGNMICSISPESSVFDALQLMSEKDVGALLVLQDNELVGIFSERDYARKVILKGKTAKDTTVKDIMSTKVQYVSPEQTLDECMALMTEKHLRHLPVYKDKELVGVISIGDVIKAIISGQKIEISQLENYIKGLLYGY